MKDINVSENKYFRSMFKLLKTSSVTQKTNLIEAIHLLDENYYSIVRVELDKSSFQSTIEREMGSVMHYNGEMNLCRAIRFYSCWLENEMVAEKVQKIDKAEETVQIHQKKPTILSFIGKEKRKDKNSMSFSGLKLSTKESKRESTFLYLQFQHFEPIQKPKQQDRLMFLLVMYQLAQLLTHFGGMQPDFTIPSMVRDRDGHLKFLRRTNKSANFNDQLHQTFLLVLSASDKPEQQQKWLEQMKELPKSLSEALRNRLDLEVPLKQLTQAQTDASITICSIEGQFKLSVRNYEIVIRLPGQESPSYEIPLDECSLESRKEVKTLYLIVKHNILQPLFIRLQKNSYVARLLRELSRQA